MAYTRYSYAVARKNHQVATKRDREELIL